MNIENIEKGMVLKSYRELCRQLGIKGTTGNAKIAQIKEMERYFSYKKEGNKFIITEVYDKPKGKPVNQRNRAYGELLQVLLTDYLIKENQKILIKSGQRLMLEAGLINEDYRNNRERFDAYSTNNEIDKEVVLDFFDTTDSTFITAIRSALKKLEQRAIIMFTEEYIVKPMGSHEHRPSTYEENEKILKLRRDLLEEMGYETMREVLFSKDQNRYKDEWSIRLGDEMDIEFVYKGYVITMLKSELPRQQLELIGSVLSNKDVKAIMDDEQQSECRDHLNATVIKRLLQNAEKRAERAIKEMEETKVKMAFGEDKITLKGKKLARTHENYVSNVDRIIEDNIKLKKTKENKEENKKDKK